MKAATKRNLNIAFILGTLLFILIIGINNNELKNIGQAFSNISPLWLVACLGAWACFLLLESASIAYFLYKQGYPLNFKYVMFVSLMGLYYSNITPGASGGQPMQVYYLKKRDVPIGVGSSVLTLKFFCFQLMLLVLGGIAWIAQPGFVQDQLWGLKVFLIAGYLFNSFSVCLIIFMVVNKRMVRFFILLFIRVGTLMHICKDPVQSAAKWEGILATFHSSVMLIRKRPKELLVQLFINGLQVLSIMLVTVFVYHALGLRGMPTIQIITMALMLYISASYTPLPGASGAQEFGFSTYMKNIFPATEMFSALLLWRLFTYYMTLVVGAITTVVQTTRGIIKAPSSKLDEQAALVQAPFQTPEEQKNPEEENKA